MGRPRTDASPPAVKPKRKKRDFDAERARAVRDCARHLADLRRAHAAGPPGDVKVMSDPLPKRFWPTPAGIFSSPARLCAEQSGEG